MSDTERPILDWRCPGCGTEYTRAIAACGQNEPTVCREIPLPVYGPNAQDVIDALRLLLTQDDIDGALLRHLVDRAPETDGDRGVELLLEMIRDGKAQVFLR